MPTASNISTNGWAVNNPVTDNSTGDTYCTLYDDVTFESYLFKVTPSNVVTTVQLSTLPGNPLNSPGSNDQHLCLALHLDADGYVWITGGYHNTSMRIIRFDTPRSITSTFTNHSTDAPFTGIYAFPAIYKLNDGSLLFNIFRSDDANVTMNNAMYRLPSSPAGTTWTKLPDVGSGLVGTPTWYGGFASNVYVHPVDGSLHLGIVWQRDKLYPGVERWGPVAYVKSFDNGSTWRAIDNSLQTLPLTYTIGPPASTGLSPGGYNPGTNNVNGLVIDPVTGYPIMLVTNLAGSYWILQWNGTSWVAPAFNVPYTFINQLVVWNNTVWVLGVGVAPNVRIRMTKLDGSQSLNLSSSTLPQGWDASYDREALRRGFVKVLHPNGMSPGFGSVGDLRRFVA